MVAPGPPTSNYYVCISRITDAYEGGGISGRLLVKLGGDTRGVLCEKSVSLGLFLAG